jgi:hypothetical protein
VNFYMIKTNSLFLTRLPNLHEGFEYLIMEFTCGDAPAKHHRRGHFPTAGAAPTSSSCNCATNHSRLSCSSPPLS